MSIRTNFTSINEKRASPSTPVFAKEAPSRHGREGVERRWSIEFESSAAHIRARQLRAQVLSEFLSSLGRGIAGGVHRLASAVTSFVIAMGETAAAWRTYEELSRLSDRQLADIGLTRSDIAAVAFRHFGDADDDATHSAVGPAELVEEDTRKAA